LNPRSPGGTIVSAAVTYAIWQPLMQVVLHLVFRDPWPFTTPAEWGAWTAASAGVGAFAGAAWHYMRGMRRGWMHRCADWSVRMLAMGMVLRANEFAPADGDWWLVLAMSALFCGLIFGTITHLFRRGRAPRVPPAERVDVPA
jgi:hypothetical protein